MDHDTLVKQAKHWIWSQGCCVVITEMTSAASEEPDIIGFLPGYSIVIECKTSRADFLNDKHKCHNRSISENMGDQRYYYAPRGIISVDELPDGYGLLEPYGRGITVRKSARFRPKKNHQGEISMLVSTLRRIKGVSPPGANIKIYREGWNKKARATLGIKECQ